MYVCLCGLEENHCVGNRIGPHSNGVCSERFTMDGTNVHKSVTFYPSFMHQEP